LVVMINFPKEKQEGMGRYSLGVWGEFWEIFPRREANDDGLK